MYRSWAFFSPSTDLRKRNKGRKKVKGRRYKKKIRSKIGEEGSKFEGYKRRGKIKPFLANIRKQNFRK